MGKALKTDLYRRQYEREGKSRDGRRYYVVGAENPAYASKPHTAEKRNPGRVSSRPAAKGERRGYTLNSQMGIRAGKPQKRRKARTLRRKIILGLWIYFGIAGFIATCFVLLGLFFGIKAKVQAAGAWIEKHTEAVSEINALQEDNMTEMSGAEGTAGTSGTLGTAGITLPVMNVSAELQKECQELYREQGNLLILVNKGHELSADYQPELRTICNGRLQAAAVLYDDLCDMLEAAGREGYEYWIASAYRAREYQQGLVDEDVQDYMAKGYSYEDALRKTLEYTMPAGYSEHETGLALDILCSTNTMMDESQAGEPGNQWLQQHCAEYGFILRYPEEKEEITGIEYEPWHLRYVGKEAAGFLSENGWTLEEFHGVAAESVMQG